MKTAAQVRLALLDFLRRDLIGPAGGHDEVLSEEPPRIRYVAGVLFPQESRRNESEAAGGLEGDEISGKEDEILELDETAPPRPTGARHERAENDEYDDIVTLANTYRPSAMGLSFMVEPGDSRLTVQVRAARTAGVRKRILDVIIRSATGTENLFRFSLLRSTSKLKAPTKRCVKD